MMQQICATKPRPQNLHPRYGPLALTKLLKQVQNQEHGRWFCKLIGFLTLWGPSLGGQNLPLQFSKVSIPRRVQKGISCWLSVGNGGMIPYRLYRDYRVYVGVILG